MPQQLPEFREKSEGRPENARRLFILVAVLACFGLIGGVWSIRTSIDQSLSFTDPSILSNTSTPSDEENEEALLLSLRTKDTDQDGLTDYQELYEYGSSPYIADSDSDGISDKDEVNNGDDPNCPAGTACTPIAIFSPTIGATNTSTNASTTTNPSVENLNTDELRTALRNAGAPQSELDAMSDEELVALYQEVLGAQDTTTNDATTDSTSLTYEELRDLSATEIRQLLILGGAEEATLAQLDDETLKAVFYESVQNLELNNTSE